MCLDLLSLLLFSNLLVFDEAIGREVRGSPQVYPSILILQLTHNACAMNQVSTAENTIWPIHSNHIIPLLLTGALKNERQHIMAGKKKPGNLHHRKYISTYEKCIHHCVHGFHLREEAPAVLHTAACSRKSGGITTHQLAETSAEEAGAGFRWGACSGKPEVLPPRHTREGGQRPHAREVKHFHCAREAVWTRACLWTVEERGLFSGSGKKRNKFASTCYKELMNNTSQNTVGNPSTMPALIIRLLFPDGPLPDTWRLHKQWFLTQTRISCEGGILPENRPETRVAWININRFWSV